MSFDRGNKPAILYLADKTMTGATLTQIQTRIAYYDQKGCDPDAFCKLVDRRLEAADVPFATRIEKNIPVYDMAVLAPKLSGDTRYAILAEWAHVLMELAGAVVLTGGYTDPTVLDEATEVYRRIIATEKEMRLGGADHFATAGANDRIWNSLQKLCEAAPEVFLRYFANVPIDAVCQAWLGPNYQMTAQVNVVHPGGAAQQAHRDYHLGFQTADVSAQYPAHVHHLSPVLTLQGAIAHCDMPLESGPTKLLPFSQAYSPGYAAWRRDDFRAIFEDRYVQLPLAKGDALFFNPALFHAAGANTSTSIERMANLLQVSSAFGRAMETIDRKGMCKLIYPHARVAQDLGTLDSAALTAAIAATAEGYSFPTNLDRDPPKDGLAPQTQQACFLRALKDGWDNTTFSRALDDMAEAQKP